MGTTASYLRGTVGPSGYSSSSTAEDVIANLDLTSKTVIVTGTTPPLSSFHLGHGRNAVIGNAGTNVFPGFRVEVWRGGGVAGWSLIKFRELACRSNIWDWQRMCEGYGQTRSSCRPRSSECEAWRIGLRRNTQRNARSSSGCHTSRPEFFDVSS